jgi:hypothetical protein
MRKSIPNTRLVSENRPEREDRGVGCEISAPVARMVKMRVEQHESPSKGS